MVLASLILVAGVIAAPLAPVLSTALSAQPGQYVQWDDPNPAGSIARYEVMVDNSPWISAGLYRSIQVPGQVGVYEVAVRACAAICSEAAVVTLTVQVPPPPGVIVVAPGGDVQAALNACKPGERVQLQAGARYVGAFVGPTKAAPGCTLTSSATLPARRITVADAGLLPVLASPSIAESALSLVNAANWRIDGVAIECTGDGDLVVLQDADRITFDRILIACANGQKRGIRGNGTNVTLTRSHLAGIWKAGQDSQAFAAWDGAGPYTITDNFLEAASENVMFGGSNSGSSERIPADILIEGNLFTKDLAWKGQPRNVKNLLEFKQVRRVVVRNNVFERSWVDGQGGVAVLFSTMNDDGGSPWAIVSDVLFEKNTIRDAVVAFGVVGRDSYNLSAQGTNLTIQDNICTGISGEFMRIADDWNVLTVRRNTCDNVGHAALLWGTPYAVRNLTWQDNTLANALIAGDGVSYADALPRYVEVFNGVPTKPTPPPEPPPVDPCVAEPITLTVTAWPTKNRKTRADFSVFSPRGAASVTFSFQGNTAVSATATDGTCSVTVTR